MNPIPYINGAFTLIENGLNVASYLPSRFFPFTRSFAVKFRFVIGLVQLVGGLAIAIFGFLANTFLPALAKQSYLSLPMQAVSLGLLYANHGAFHLIRTGMEYIDIPGLTLLYDFYGKKFLPALSGQCDLLSLLFHKIRDLFNRIQFVTIFPPQIGWAK